ncbi:hypothetical protein C9374_009308 [Naegleria lovaniensis]|uniref:Uncharacterized protein n=1 Tax=Naegleria lovaniensis TaxID=51637 RepID=A0AA88KEC6_NAELO|nr:uncharacterized protein C9374_009308 [Naegleria lovaniensis]KAG2377397.1 hypothetical protein C9374_009308 [Naegleria lovaniensis]
MESLQNFWSQTVVPNSSKLITKVKSLSTTTTTTTKSEMNPPTTTNDSENTSSPVKETALGATVGGVVAGSTAYVGIPTLASLLGFGKAGIASCSLASSWMSAVAVANGGGVAAGSTVATLQSIGAAGAVGLTTTVLPVAIIGGVVVGAGVYGYKKYYKKNNNENGNGNSGK